MPDIEPHYVGGIRLTRQTWLAGFAPRIRFTGELGKEFQVTIDGQPGKRAGDGAFEAPGWNAAPSWEFQPGLIAYLGYDPFTETGLKTPIGNEPSMGQKITQAEIAENTESFRGGIGRQPKDTLGMGNEPLAAKPAGFI